MVGRGVLDGRSSETGCEDLGGCSSLGLDRHGRGRGGLHRDCRHLAKELPEPELLAIYDQAVAGCELEATRLGHSCQD